MTSEEKLFDMLAKQSALLSRPLRKTEWLTITKGFLATLGKERKKSQIDDRAESILRLFPRREGGDAALVAISKAIWHDGFELVHERTSEYASAVARWSQGRRKSQSGSSLIPLPKTWFGNRRYTDDPKAWWDGTGGKPKAELPAPPAPVAVPIDLVKAAQNDAASLERMLASPEPEKETLAHAMWLHARNNLPVESPKA